MQSGGAVSRYLPSTAPGWLRSLARTLDNFLRHEMSTYAAALAYRGLLALFPFVIFLVALVNTLEVWRLPAMFAAWARTGPQGRVPAAIKEWMVVQAFERPEGAVLSVGAVAALWAVASGARVLRRALNVTADMPEVHPPWLRLALSFVVAPALGTAIVAAVVLFTVTRRFLLRLAGWFDVNEIVVALWDWLRLPVGVVLASLAISVVYMLGPSRRQHFRSVLPGAVIAALVWAVASFIFPRAASSALQFGATYGSFTAAIVLLVYLYLAAAGLLFGAELNTVLLRTAQPERRD